MPPLGDSAAARKIGAAHHILTFVRTLGPGGVERAVLRLAQGWLAAGRRVTMVLGEATGPLASEVPPGLELVSLGSPTMRSLLALPRIVASRSPDILFCPGNHYSSTAAWVRLQLGAACPPIVVKMSSATERADQGRLARLGQRAWLAMHPRFVDHLVAMTPATAAAAARATQMPPGRVSVIANPPGEPLAGIAPPSLPSGRFLLGVGRLVRQKRWDRAIAALPALADQQVSLVILGDGPDRATLAAQAQEIGIGHRLHLPGHAADPLAVMARAAALVLPSDYEGVPSVLREALSMGTPVVATDSSPAVAEIVTDGTLGTVVGRNDADGLVAALDRWLAPDAARPAPVAPPGLDAAACYLDLFDRLLSRV